MSSSKFVQKNFQVYYKFVAGLLPIRAVWLNAFIIGTRKKKMIK